DPNAARIERHAIADLDAERLREALLERDARVGAARVRRPEMSVDDTIADRQSVRPRQVEFALREPSRPRVLVARRIERRTVQLDEAAAHHRLELRVDTDALCEPSARIVDLVG